MSHPSEQFFYLYDREDVRNSLVKIDLLAFFQVNPHAVDTVAGFARRLHRPPKEVAAAAEALAGIGILERIESGSHTIYRLRSVDKDAEGGTFLEGSRGNGSSRAGAERCAERNSGGHTGGRPEGDHRSPK